MFNYDEPSRSPKQVLIPSNLLLRQIFKEAGIQPQNARFAFQGLPIIAIHQSWELLSYLLEIALYIHKQFLEFNSSTTKDPPSLQHVRCCDFTSHARVVVLVKLKLIVLKPPAARTVGSSEKNKHKTSIFH